MAVSNSDRIIPANKLYSNNLLLSLLCVVCCSKLNNTEKEIPEESKKHFKVNITLVGPTRENLITKPLAVLSLDNQL